MKIYVESLLCGLMVYWDEVSDASRYYVHLLIGDKHKTMELINGMRKAVYKDETYQEIAVVEVERNIKYHSFFNLAKINEGEPGACKWGRVAATDTGKNYYIYVEAEDKKGDIINKSDKVVGDVYVMSNGYFSHRK